jgi:hypothetical protein
MSQSLSLTSEPIATSDLDEIAVRLQGKLSGRIRNLQLLHNARGLILRGIARTYHAKQLAQHLLMGETRVPIFANEIEVH